MNMNEEWKNIMVGAVRNAYNFNGLDINSATKLCGSVLKSIPKHIPPFDMFTHIHFRDANSLAELEMRRVK